MRVGVIGLGYWGPNLVRNLCGLDGCTSVMVCDLDEARVKRVVEHQSGVLGTTRYQDVLADPSVEAVVIATPVRTHVDLARASLEAGKSTLVEKPLATSARDAVGLVDEARERGLLVMAGHTFLHSPAVQVTRDLVRDGAIGKPLYLQSSRVNLGIHQSDVSVLWDLAPHDLSIVLECIGERPVRVSAFGRSTLKAGPPDVAFVDLEFPSRFVANLHLSWLAPTKMRRTTIVGSRKMLVYEDTNPEEPVKIYDKGVNPPDSPEFGQHKLTYRTGDIVAPRVATSEPLANELETFIARTAAGEVPDEREDAAVAVVEIIEAAERSLAESGQPVPVPVPAAPAGRVARAREPLASIA
jgi:predicted dehydrogenase